MINERVVLESERVGLGCPRGSRERFECKGNEGHGPVGGRETWREWNHLMDYSGMMVVERQDGEDLVEGDEVDGFLSQEANATTTTTRRMVKTEEDMLSRWITIIIINNGLVPLYVPLLQCDRCMYSVRTWKSSPTEFVWRGTTKIRGSTTTTKLSSLVLFAASQRDYATLFR